MAVSVGGGPHGAAPFRRPDVCFRCASARLPRL